MERRYRHIRRVLSFLILLTHTSAGFAVDTAMNWEELDSRLEQDEHKLRDTLAALDAEIEVEEHLAFGGDERIDLNEKEAFLSGKYLGVRLRRISLGKHRNWSRSFSRATALKTAPVANTPDVQWYSETAREELYWLYGSALVAQVDEKFPWPKLTKLRNEIASHQRELQVMAQNPSPSRQAHKKQAQLASRMRRAEHLLSHWEDREDALMLDAFWRGMSEGFGFRYSTEVQERLFAAERIMQEVGFKIPRKEGCALYLI